MLSLKGLIVSGRNMNGKKNEIQIEKTSVTNGVNNAFIHLTYKYKSDGGQVGG